MLSKEKKLYIHCSIRFATLHLPLILFFSKRIISYDEGKGMELANKLSFQLEKSWRSKTVKNCI